jgi:hypothetical protein
VVLEPAAQRDRVLTFAMHRAVDNVSSSCVYRSAFEILGVDTTGRRPASSIVIPCHLCLGAKPWHAARWVLRRSREAGKRGNCSAGMC